jgi:putative transposase
LVTAPQTDADLEALRRSVRRGCPFGAPGWQEQVARRLGLAHTLRPLGRPKKARPGKLPAPR